MIWQTLNPFSQLVGSLDSIRRVVAIGVPSADCAYPMQTRHDLHAAGISQLLADTPDVVEALLAGDDVASQVTM